MTLNEIIKKINYPSGDELMAQTYITKAVEKAADAYAGNSHEASWQTVVEQVLIATTVDRKDIDMANM